MQALSNLANKQRPSGRRADTRDISQKTYSFVGDQGLVQPMRQSPTRISTAPLPTTPQGKLPFTRRPHLSRVWPTLGQTLPQMSEPQMTGDSL